MKIVRLDVSKLSNDPANARKHDERNIAAIVASLRRFGQQKPIVVDSTNVVRAGNGTLEAARVLGWDKIDAVVTGLSGSEATAYAIADNRTAELAAWDEEILAAELNGLLADDAELLDAAGFTEEELAALLADGESGGEQQVEYTRKIEAPIYRPRGDCPPVTALTDSAKCESLTAEIAAVDLPEDVREFLVAAARRHVEFDFEQIAEFYCHATPEVQRLMERSALVVIDFDKAIENGYVELSQKLASLYGEEYPE